MKSWASKRSLAGEIKSSKVIELFNAHWWKKDEMKKNKNYSWTFMLKSPSNH